MYLKKWFFCVFFFWVYYIYFQKAMFEYEGERNRIESMHSFGERHCSELDKECRFFCTFLN